MGGNVVRNIYNIHRIFNAFPAQKVRVALRKLGSTHFVNYTKITLRLLISIAIIFVRIIVNRLNPLRFWDGYVCNCLDPLLRSKKATS